MDTKKAIIKIELIGGVDFPEWKDVDQVSKEILNDILVSLNKRKDSMMLTSFSEESKRIDGFPDSLNFLATIQKIEIIL